MKSVTDFHFRRKTGGTIEDRIKKEETRDSKKAVIRL